MALCARVASALGRTVKQVRRQLIYTGGLPHQRITGKRQGIYVSQRDLDAYLERDVRSDGDLAEVA